MKLDSSLIKKVRPYVNSLRVYQSHYYEVLQNLFKDEIAIHLPYVCPLCLHSIIVLHEKGAHANSNFTLDHFPPQNAGGRKTVLVCEKCNSSAGTNYESELKKELIQRSFNKRLPNSPLKIKSKIKDVPGGPYKSSFTISADNVLLFDMGRLDKTPFISKWLSDVKLDPKKLEINIQGIFPDAKKVRKALLKISYLYCFSLWGYEFAFSNTGINICRCLLGEIEYPIKEVYVYWLEDKIDHIPEGVGFIRRPHKMQNYIVNIPLTLKESGYKCVVGVPIPNSSANGWKELSNFYLTEEMGEIQVAPLLPFDKNRRTNGYSFTWNKIEKGEMKENI